MEDRRHSYQSFDPELISPFLQSVGAHLTIHTVELCTTGRSNTHYKLTLSDDSIYILRLYAQSKPEQDTYIFNLVKDVVPVPELLAQGPRWAILSFLPGKLLSDCPEDVDKAATALAHIAAIQFKAPGQLQTDGLITPFGFGGLSGYIARQLDRSEVQSWLSLKTLKQLQQLQGQDASLLQELDAETYLVHGDFNPTNILIQNGQVSGILDWDYCHSGTPYMDIGNLLRHTPSHQYQQIKVGLEHGGMALPEDWQQRAEWADLASQLEFLTSSRSDVFKQQCVDRVNLFLRMYFERSRGA
ncbi:aminoglycoside phosphotransferase family protein [Acaryochloris sp. 'Moss Beach']|uniref:aminoglycoside phosphotransferase family protein n=1 Tax=Acaryochloris sp. 'Moss Beach' TaxID=2740837 RepID=UPI001F431A76|nr:aminoglycoside phosphotransferase family protein [Acaryochloris sp. 'Moss Beach']UJB67796.1 aminoglycoside phosphotransferase family protein [Acaryochloris sp. 'Moss Beach']